jgi:acetoin utilization deacetylase AcuC-like enzyme
MMRHFSLLNPLHPEKPERIKAIVDMLKEKGLWQRCNELGSRHATDEELLMCHENAYIQRIKSLADKSKEELIELTRNPNYVYFHSETFECATLATGCLLQVVDQVCSGKSTNGVAICRPPGHHAYPDSCSGFCIFNSIAIAARYAQNKYSSRVRK